MSEDRRSILNMLGQGKITPDEAERLLAAMEREPARSLPGGDPPPAGHNKPAPKYLRVTVDTDDDEDGPTKVNVRVPMQLLRAGVRRDHAGEPHARCRAGGCASRSNRAIVRGAARNCFGTGNNFDFRNRRSRSFRNRNWRGSCVACCRDPVGSSA